MRRFLLALVLAALCSAPSEAAVSLVSGQIATDTTTPFETDEIGQLSFPSACTVGNVIYVVFGTSGNRSPSTPTDDGSGGTNTYVTDAGLTALQAGGGEVFFYWAPCDRAAQTVSVDVNSAADTYGFMAILEFTGLNTSDLLEDTTTATTSSVMAHNSGTLTTTVNDSLIIGILIGGNGTYVNDVDSWTEILNAGVGGNSIAAYKILSSTAAAEEWNVTSAQNETAALVAGAFNGTGGGGPTGANPALLTLGVGEPQ